MKKKIFTLAIALFAIVCGTRAQDGFTPPAGSGTIDDPCQITSAGQLAHMGSGGYEMKYAILMNNIDLTDWIANNSDADIQTNGWNPPDAFRKTFDGNGFTISGLWSNRPGNQVGLFYQVQSQDDSSDPGYTGACVKNLNIEIDPKGIIGGDNVGGLVAHVNKTNIAPVTISNVHVYGGSVTGTSAVGGVVGRLEEANCVIDGCSAEGVEIDVSPTVLNGSNYFGGIIGQKNEGPSTFAIKNSHFSGTINGWSHCGGIAGAVGPNSTVDNCYVDETTVVNGVGDNIGGLLGSAGQNASASNLFSPIVIQNSYSKAAVNCGGGTAAGLIGLMELQSGALDPSADPNSASINVLNCYATGDVTTPNGSDCAGLIGSINDGVQSLLIDNCYYSGTITGGGGGDPSDADGGLVGSAQNGNTTITNSHALGSVSSGCNAGGIIGFFSGGSIRKCFSNCDVTGGGDAGGGIAGNITAPVDIEQCYATGNVTGGNNTGGIAGLIRSTAGATISECYASGELNVQYNERITGGLVGQVQDGGSLTLDKSFALSPSVTGNTTGVLVGSGSIVTSTNNFALNNLNDGVANTDGAPAFISQTDAQTQTTYTNVSWDFASVWTMGTVAPFYPVFGQSSPSALIIGPTDTKTASDYTSGGYTDIIIQSSEDASGVISTGQLILDNGDLTVAGVVKFEQSFTVGKWYAVGFPFDVASMSCDGVDHNLKTYDSTGANDSYGDFWLKNDYDYTDNTFAYTQPATSIPAGGYILQVPSDISGKTIAFTSAPGLVLSSSSVFDIQAGNYKITNNPSFANTVVTNNGTTNVDANGNSYYTYESKKPNNFDLATTWTLRPFESLVIANNPPYLRSDLGIDGVTSLPAVNLQGDKVVATEYYNLMGVKVAQPDRGNIYVVKTIFESGKTSVVKQFIDK